MAENNLKPKIRFKGFSDDWKQYNLGEIYKFQYGQFNNNPSNGGIYPVYGANGIIGGYSGFNAENSVIIGHMGEYAGSVLWGKGRHFVTYNGTISVPKLENINSKYGYYMLYQLNINKICGGSGLPFLAYDKLQKINCFVPSLDEQIKISKVLSVLDSLIKLHQLKYDKLVNIKKAMLEKMFPKNGSKVPEIRFKGFTDDWEQYEFLNVFTMLQNNTLSRADLNYEQGSAKCVHYGDVLIKFGECLDVKREELPFISDDTIVTKYKASFLQNGDVIMADAAEDETVGKCCEIVGLDTQILISGLHTIPFRHIEAFATGYLGYYMNSSAYHNQLLPLMQGTKVSSVSKSALRNTTITYPKSVEEQKKIGKYFTQLDNLIKLHQRKYNKLVNIKKAMFEKMFV